MQDTDGDGLLDSIESSSGWKEPNDQPLPDIHSMFTYKVANGTWTDSLGTVPMSADSAPVTDTIVIN